MKCKLCGSDKTVRLKSISASEIKNRYSINVDKFFKDDYVVCKKCLNCDLKYFDNVLPGDESFYDELQNNELYYEEEKTEFDYALSKLAEINPKSILEVGAGRGFFLEKIKDSYNVRASEFSKKSLNYLREKQISLDEKDLKYDFVCSFQVLEHIEDIQGIFNFFDEKLNEKGYLLLSVPNNDSIYFKEVFDYLDYPPHHMYQYSKKSLLYLADKFQYEILDYWVEPLRIEHYSYIIKRRRFKLMNQTPIKRSFFALFDYLLAPYFYSNNENGHSHAILLRKSTRQ